MEVWNEIPIYIRTVNSIVAFKSKYKNYLLTHE